MKYSNFFSLGKEVVLKLGVSLVLATTLLAINPANADTQRIDDMPSAVRSMNNTGYTTNYTKEFVVNTIVQKKSIEVAEINDFWNKSITYKREAPGQDVWQTPEETLRLRTGDCEDIAIAKYFDLIASGANKDDVSLVWVGVKDIGLITPKYESHIVVLYKIKGVDYVLDNYNQDIVPLSQRTDLFIAGKMNHDLSASEFYQGNGKHLTESWSGVLKGYNQHLVAIQDMKGLPLDTSTLLADKDVGTTKIKDFKQTNNSILALRAKSLDSKATSANKPG